MNTLASGLKLELVDKSELLSQMSRTLPVATVFLSEDTSSCCEVFAVCSSVAPIAG